MIYFIHKLQKIFKYYDSGHLKYSENSLNDLIKETIFYLSYN